MGFPRLNLGDQTIIDVLGILILDEVLDLIPFHQEPLAQFTRHPEV